MKVVTAVVNNPDFIEMQYYTLKKYMKGEYEFIIFNDAKDFPDFTNDGDMNIKVHIENMCTKLNIKCINIPNEHHKELQSAAARCADAMNYILEYQKQHPDKYLLLDSDMFLIADFDVNRYKDYSCAIVLQQRENDIFYFWNGIYYFDMNKLTDIELLNWNTTPKCDVGGMMQTWLKKKLQDKSFPDCLTIRYSDITFTVNDIYFIKHLWSCTWNESEMPHTIENYKALVEFIISDKRNENGKFFCEIYENVFLHYRAGGNWRREGLSFHIQQTKKLKDLLMDPK
jgi:hypothetical protein